MQLTACWDTWTYPNLDTFSATVEFKDKNDKSIAIVDFDDENALALPKTSSIGFSPVYEYDLGLLGKWGDVSSWQISNRDEVDGQEPFHPIQPKFLLASADTLVVVTDDGVKGDSASCMTAGDRVYIVKRTGEEYSELSYQVYVASEALGGSGDSGVYRASPLRKDTIEGKIFERLATQVVAYDLPPEGVAALTVKAMIFGAAKTML